MVFSAVASAADQGGRVCRTVARNVTDAAPIRTPTIATAKSSGSVAYWSTVMMPLLIVLDTSAPIVSAPPHSTMLPRTSASRMLRAPEPTDVPIEFAMSFAPEQERRLRSVASYIHELATARWPTPFVGERASRARSSRRGSGCATHRSRPQARRPRPAPSP